METFELKTGVDEVIDYNNIVVEKVQEITIPEKIEVVKTAHTVGSVNQRLIEIKAKIKALQDEEIEFEALKVLVEKEADKVVNAIKLHGK